MYLYLYCTRALLLLLRFANADARDEASTLLQSSNPNPHCTTERARTRALEPEGIERRPSRTRRSLSARARILQEEWLAEENENVKEQKEKEKQ